MQEREQMVRELERLHQQEASAASQKKARAAALMEEVRQDCLSEVHITGQASN